MTSWLRKKKYIPSGSLSSLAWRKFKKNRIAFASLLFIGLIALVSILGYLITPDKTPFCNQQHIELAVKKPGFKVDILLIRKNEMIDQKGLFHTMLFGKKSRFSEIPINSFEIKGENIIIEEYSEDQEFSEKRSFLLADILFPVSSVDFDVKNSNFKIIQPDGLVIKENLVTIREAVLKHNLISRSFILGTDRFGRDMLSRILLGTRVSLAVGFISVFISLFIGLFIGSLGGFFRGWVDQIVVWFINVVWSIPTLLLVIAISFALGKGFWQIFIAVGLTMWVEVARVSRGQIISLREKEYIEAGKVLGFGNLRIIFKHILPNIMAPVIVIAAANFAAAILIEAGLSFLGIGVQPPMPSWGSMIKENYAYIILDAAYLAIIPGLAIMLIVLAFMLAGNGLRDALDVKTN